jgi:CRP-like cAMP-binding protein
MWNPNASSTSGHRQASLVSATELQALFDDAPAAGHAQRSVSGWTPVQALSGGDNLILAALPDAERDALTPHLERVSLSSGQVIGQPGHALQHVYFPLSCSVSWVSHTADGESAELALVGRDGLIGVPLVLGGLAMQHTVQVQCGGQALRMGAEVFSRWLDTHSRLHKLALLYVQRQMAQMAQSIVCSRHHAVSERLSHWLLSNAQAAHRSELLVTHETISQMLGVRRESITQAAGRFQAAGWLGNSRGKITLKDPEGLRAMACECQTRSQTESQRYLQQLSRLGQPSANQDHDSLGLQAWAAVPNGQGDGSPDPLPPYGMSHGDDTLQPADAQLQKYVDAYDFAPVGFVTLDAKGKILQTNLAGAIMLDIQRSQCQQHLFADFLDGASHTPFARFHHEVLGGQCRRHCVVHLMPTTHRGTLPVRIDATADEWGVENRMVLIDVSDQHHAQDQAAHWQFQTQGAAASPAGWRP